MASGNDSLADRIKQRSETVALIAEQRRARKGLNAAESENQIFFADNFQILKDGLVEKLNRKNEVEKGGIIEYLDEMVQDVSKMQQFLNESSMFLPSFWIKKAQEDINTLNVSVQASGEALQPKKKFGFKNKRKDPSVEKKVNQSVIDASAPVNKSITEELKRKAFFGFKDRVGETLEMAEDDLRNRQFHLQNLSDCRVIALGNPGALQFANLRNTIVLIGPTSRSGFIKHCVNCTFVLACQQVRIHDCESTNFYLHVTGSAIIEGCKGLSFAPYTLEYPQKDTHYEQSGLSRDINYWDKIEDFHWLNENEISPNFKLLEENEREKDWL